LPTSNEYGGISSAQHKGLKVGLSVIVWFQQLAEQSYNFPRMLTEATLGFLSTLTYRADAKRLVSWMPLSGIHWEDELPHIHLLHEIPENDLDQILRLFNIRVRLWHGEVLSDKEQQLWDATYSQVPQWAFFRREHVSDDDQHAQEAAERGGAIVYEALFAEADEITIVENDGIQHISATFDLTKEQVPPQKKPRLWRRVFHRKRSDEL